MKKKIILSAIIFVAILGAIKADAWVEPKQGEEMPALLNTGSDGQEKKGWLNINNWIRVITEPFSFDVGVEAPKFCIKKPDGTQSCCPPKAGEDWSACGGSPQGEGGARWVWNTERNKYPFWWTTNILRSSYDMLLEYPLKDSKKVERSENRFCDCYDQNGSLTVTLDRFHFYTSLSTSSPNYDWGVRRTSCATLCADGVSAGY